MIKLNEIIPSTINKNEVTVYEEVQSFIDVNYKIIKEKKEKQKTEEKKQFAKVIAILSGTFLFLNTIFIACILFKSGLDLYKITGPAVAFLLLAVSHNIAKEKYYND